jgi:cytidylate kinase
VKATIGIFGSSCSGKTTVAKALASRVGCEVRNCGELVRARAAALGLQPSALPDTEHLAIDADTRRTAAHGRNALIIDGTFLDHVLAELEAVWLVKLIAEPEERERRHRARGLTGGLPDRDDADELIRRHLYGDKPPERASYTIDTTDVSVSDVVADIERRWRNT